MNKTVLFFIALFLGVLGIHDFIQKKIVKGVTHLLVTIVAIIGLGSSVLFQVLFSIFKGSEHQYSTLYTIISNIALGVLIFSFIWAVYDAVMILTKKEA